MKKSRMTLRVLAALMAVMLMTMSGAPALAASFKARINSSAAKVYNVPSTASKIYVQGGKGVTVTVTGYAKGWARIMYKGNTGYTPVKNLNLVNRPKGYTKKSTPVYRQDSTASTLMGTLSMGSTVYVCGVSGNFYRIQNASGSVTGYVQKGTLATQAQAMEAYKKYKAYLAAQAAASKKPAASKPSSGTGTVTPTKPSTPVVDNRSPLDKLFDEALSHLGKGYARDATPPSTFNCSAYVKYVFGEFGINMKSTAVEQCADSRYTYIGSLSDIKKGDILCFDTTESDDAADGKLVCDHTAIYYGNNTFLESSQKAGRVQPNTLDDWYRKRFICARRVL